MEKKQSKNIELEIRKASEELTEEDLERVTGGSNLCDLHCPQLDYGD